MVKPPAPAAPAGASAPPSPRPQPPAPTPRPTARPGGPGLQRTATLGNPAGTTTAAPLPPPPPPPPPAKPAGDSGPSFSPFGAKDPNARAERLARALVSDIVAYYPDRREKSLAEGTIRSEFREEILKSWEEYVAQVGLPLAKSTPHFRMALNKILAKGQNVF
ncbi:MAG: hypothetical protein ACREL7_00270 [Longimicrobiales bacterium]